jgi:hypothetical protein
MSNSTAARHKTHAVAPTNDADRQKAARRREFALMLGRLIDKGRNARTYQEEAHHILSTALTFVVQEQFDDAQSLLDEKDVILKNALGNTDTMTLQTLSHISVERFNSNLLVDDPLYKFIITDEGFNSFSDPESNEEQYKAFLKAIADNRKKDEGSLNTSLKQYLREKKIPPELWNETADEIERVIRKQAIKGEARPLWDARARYPELADLSAPEFLKRVWADQIGPDGSIERAAVSQKDKKLLALVDAYIGRRKDRRQDAGAAAGLRFIRSHVGRPRVPTPT